ncbi:hypothetical protein EVAR_88589_1 [Eumeta japonica]|uniref:Uncharacterized protein n=1 Tax=Eumeta variegata TaxID=151549 RepID=A0A4C1Y5C7_EUMVA|nr:hypothetical protein EVAR_88589_1 [Eumeta japonica]
MLLPSRSCSRFPIIISDTNVGLVFDADPTFYYDPGRSSSNSSFATLCPIPLRLGVTLKSVTLGNVTMSHRTRGPPNALRLSHSTMIGLPRAQH